jgi:hypothetical protein
VGIYRSLLRKIKRGTFTKRDSMAVNNNLKISARELIIIGEMLSHILPPRRHPDVDTLSRELMEFRGLLWLALTLQGILGMWSGGR